MKMWKKLLTSVLTVALLVSLSAGSAMAAKTEYTYTVTFYAGVQGVFNGAAGLSVDNADAVIAANAEKITVSNLQAGDVVSFNAQANISLDSTSKYYVQGVRLSGRDNDTVATSAFKVDGDEDYVVAYGIKGNVTSYTVNYLDADGNELASSETYYGNIGDKPVVAYKYIEGYAPQAFALTKTLGENAAENVFTFVYEDMPEPTVEEVVQIVPGSGDNTGTTTPGTTTPGTSQNQSDEQPSDETETESEQPGESESNDPEEIINLDDPEEVPLANEDLDGNSAKMILSVGLLVASVIALILLAVLVIKKKKNA